MRTTLTLCMTFTPAYQALVAVILEIAEALGEERAMAFMQAAMDADPDAFINMAAEAARPKLHLVHSAA